MSATHYSEIGQFLKAAREEMGLSLRAASEHTFIRSHYLDALEQGRLADLPDLPYVRGFLQTYSTLLGLDKDEILRRWSEVEAQLDKKSLSLPEVFSKEKTPTTPIIWGSLGFGLLFYLIWLAAFKPAPVAMDVAEKPPAGETHTQPAQTLLVGACFRLAGVLYPPCYMAREVGLYVDGQYPPRGQITSVMELAR